MDPIRGVDYSKPTNRIESTSTKTAAGERFGNAFSLAEEAKKRKEAPEESAIVNLSQEGRRRQTQMHEETKPTPKEEDYIDLEEAFGQARNFLQRMGRTIVQVFSIVRKALADFWNSAGETSDGKQPEEFSEMDEKPVEELLAGEAVEIDEFTGEHGPALILPEIYRNGETGEEEAAETEEISALTSVPKSAAEEAREYLDSVDLRSYVKNSDLLTYYDRSGKLVTPSESDRNRILNRDSYRDL